MISRLLAGFVLLASLPASAQDLVTVAVLDFSVQTGVSGKQAGLLADVMANEIRSYGGFRVITREDIRNLLNFQEQKQLLGCDDTECLQEMAGAMGARYLATGRVGRIGALLVVSLTVLDAGRAQAVHGVSLKVQGGEEQLVDAVILGSRKVFAKVMPGKAVLTNEVPLPPEGIDFVKDGEAFNELTVAAPPARSESAVWGHVAFWSGAGLAVLGAVAAVVSHSAAEDYRQGDLAAEDRSRTWAGVMWGGFAGGAALMGAGMLLWLLEPSGRESAAVVVAPAGGGVGISIGGRF